MSPSALIDEKKSSQITVTAPWRGNVRVQPTVEAILDESRPANIGKGDQLIHGALQAALISGILSWDLVWVYRTVGRLIGVNPPNGNASPDSKIVT